jgi:hypothetical protein
MAKTTLVKTIVTAAIAATIVIQTLVSSASAGEGFFQKIGDGPKRFIRDIVTPNKVDPPAPAPAPAPARIPVQASTPAPVPVQASSPHFVATYRVDCRDAQTGADRADNTLEFSGPAASKEAFYDYIINLSHQKDFCQGNGDTSRVMKPGSGRFL